MKRVYVTVPAALMLVFFVYFHWWAPLPRTFRLVGDSLPWWRSHEVAVSPRISATGGDEYEGRDGAREALDHLRAGKVVLLGYGLAYPWHAELKEVWKREFGVDSHDVAGCMVTETLASYVAGYNRVMEAHIAERFGADVFDLVSRKARALYDERYPRKG